MGGESPTAQKTGNKNDRQEADVRKPTSPDDVIECGSAIDATIEAIRLNWAHLRDVNLADTNLNYARLYQADLAYSNLHGASLAGVNFNQVNLTGARVDGLVDNPASVQNANVLHLLKGSEDFCNFAVQHGAVEMSDEDWKAWRDKGFRRRAVCQPA